MNRELVFPLDSHHNHAPGIVETPAGDLLVSWYRGSGERTADDVAVYGSWQRQGTRQWTPPIVLADTPGFPDCNTCMMIDGQQRLWLFWPLVLANSWESCVTQFRMAEQYPTGQLPAWNRQGSIWLRPDDFSQEAMDLLQTRLRERAAAVTDQEQEELKAIQERLADKLHQLLGWQPRCKPIQLPSGRILLPLYSDTYSFSLMAISDDQGQTWFASEPLMGIWQHPTGATASP